MSEVLANRIYDVKIQGYEESFKKVKDLTAAFNKMDEAKRKLNEQLQKKLNAGDTSAVQQLTARIKELESNLAKLGKQKDVAAKESLLLAKAETEAAKAAAIRTKSIIDQDKELDRQIANEEKRAKKQQQSAKIVEGNYYSLMEAQRQALEQYRLTPSSSPFFEEVKKKAVEARQKVDEFNRSLSPDGTLVGEYKTGILNAFNKLGLGDVIKKQKDDISNQLRQLNQQNKALAEQFKQTGNEGTEAFNKMQKELEENINLQQRLENSLKNIDKALEGTGSMGDKVTRSISENFKGLTKQATQFALGYLGFQQTVQQVQKGLDDAKKIEGIEQAFKNLNREDLLSELRKATKGTVSDLDLMQKAVQAKNFQIPIENLAGFFEFARRRAKDTGESVDYLVQSIVLGIGRKSPLILDNLGISAVRLREKLKGVSEETVDIGSVAQAVGQIIQEENAKNSKEVDTNSEAIAANTAKWQNMRAEIAQKFLPVIRIGGSLLIGLAGILGAIPWPITTAAVLYFTASLVKNYVATAIATQQGLIYSASLVLQQIRTQAVALWTRVATAEIVLFNGAIRFSPIGIFLTLLALIIPAVAVFAQNTKAARIEMDAMREITRKANEQIAEQSSELNKWMNVLRSSTVSADTHLVAKQKLIDQFPEYFGHLKAETASIKEMTEAYLKASDAIRKKALANASAELSAAKQKEVDRVAILKTILETEGTTVESTKIIKDLSSDQIDLFTKLVNPAKSTLRANGSGGITFQANEYDKILAALDKEINKRKEVAEKYAVLEADYKKEADTLETKPLGLFERFNNLVKSGGTDTDFNTLLKDVQSKREKTNRLEKEYGELKALEEKISNLLNPKDKKENRGSRLTGEQKDAFKEIDAKRDTDLAVAQKELLDIKQVRQATRQEEIDHLNKLQQINLTAVNAKLDILNQKKNLNAEEKKTQAEFRKDIVDIQLKTQEQIDSINKKAFDEQSKLAEKEVENLLRIEKNKLDAILNDPTKSFTEKAKARQEFNFFELNAQTLFFNQIEALEQKYRIKSVDNEQKRSEAVIRIMKNIRDERLKQLDEEIKDLQVKGDESVAKLKAVINKQREEILKSNRSRGDKKAALDELDKQSSIGVLAREIKTMEEQLPLYKEKLDKKQITEKEYQDFYEEYVRKQAQLNEALAASVDKITNVQDLVRSKLSKLFGFGKGSENEKLLGQVLSETYQLAQDAMQNYFAAEEERIQRSKQLAFERIDLEKKQLLAKAQSEEERSVIERQAQQKREKAEKEAGERLKKVKKAEAKIALATELANIAVAAAQNPLNGITFGAAGIAMYTLLAGLALGRYAITTKNIEAQQFAGGGKVKPLTNGRITAAPNIETLPNGDNVLATVKPGEVILNQEQQKKLGGPGVFAAIGVPGFASGGYTGIGNFSLGDNLRAPISPSSFITGSRSSTTELEELRELIQTQAESLNVLAYQTNNRIDRLKVINDPRETVQANDRYKKATEIGTL